MTTLNSKAAWATLILTAALPPLAAAQPPRKVCWGSYAGTVLAVDAKGLIIDGVGARLIPYAEFAGVRSFPASDILRRGGFPTDTPPGLCYRLRDVQAGDEVHIDFVVEGDVEVLQHINIQRRPGGRVPPSPAERPGTYTPHHGVVNARNETEDLILPALRRLPSGLRMRVLLEADARARAAADAVAAENLARLEAMFAWVEFYNALPAALRPGAARVPGYLNVQSYPPYDEDAHLWEGQWMVARARALYRQRNGRELDVPDVFRPARQLAPPPRLAPPRPAN